VFDELEESCDQIALPVKRVIAFAFVLAICLWRGDRLDHARPYAPRSSSKIQIPRNSQAAPSFCALRGRGSREATTAIPICSRFDSLSFATVRSLCANSGRESGENRGQLGSYNSPLLLAPSPRMGSTSLHKMDILARRHDKERRASDLPKRRKCARGNLCWKF